MRVIEFFPRQTFVGDTEYYSEIYEVPDIETIESQVIVYGLTTSSSVDVTIETTQDPA